MHGHVFHQAQNGHTHLLEHRDALACIQQGNVLRRGHDHRAGNGHALTQGELDIARTGRHVHHQVVHVLPVGLAQQLFQRLRRHGAAPDHGLVRVHEKADGHDLHTMVDQRLHGLAVQAVGPAVNAHHHGLAGAVDIGVQQAHGRAFGGQRQRKIRGGGALAHPALARGHGHDVLHTGQELHAALHRMGHHFGDHLDLHAANALDRACRRFQAGAQRGLLAACGVAQLHLKRHCVAVDAQIAQGTRADKILAGTGVLHGAQGRHEPLFIDSHPMYSCGCGSLSKRPATPLPA